MIQFLLRIASVALLASAFASAVIDGTRSIAANAVTLTSFGETCGRLFPKAFPLLQPMVQARLPAWVWNPVLVDLLRVPTWLVLAVLGLAVLRLSRRRKQPIGYSSRD